MHALAKRKQVIEDKALDQIDDARDEANRYRAEAMDMRDEVGRLRDRVAELEAQIGAHQCAPIATVKLPAPFGHGRL